MLKAMVASQSVEMNSLPSGKSGELEITIAGVKKLVRFNRDDHGIWIQTESGSFGFDAIKEVSDEGQVRYQLSKRQAARHFLSTGLIKNGEEMAQNKAGAAGGVQKLKSQMPGKILRILVSAGQVVVKGQPLVVMEAMKMENEMKSNFDGTVESISVSAGQAVDSGQELLKIKI